MLTDSPAHSRSLPAIIIASLIAGVGFFDFVAVLYLSELLLRVFFGETSDVWLVRLQLATLLLASYLLRPAAGLLIGRYADEFGRKPALYFSLCTAAVLTLMLGVLPSHAQIGFIAPILFIITRMLHGIATAGMMPSVWVYVGEHLPMRHLGLGSAMVLAACILSVPLLITLIGWLDGVLSYGQMLNFGWRIPFLCSALVSLLLLLIYKTMPETPVFHQHQARTHSHQQSQEILSLSSLFEHSAHQNKLPSTDKPSVKSTSKTDPAQAKRQVSNHKAAWFDKLVYQTKMAADQLADAWFNKSMFNNLIIATTLISAMISLLTFTPVLLSTLIDLNFSVSAELLWRGNLLAIIFMAIGCVIFGLLADRFNAGWVLMLGSLVLAIQALLFFNHLESGSNDILVFFAVFGLSSGVIGAMPSVFIRLFSTKIRLSSIGFLFNLAAALIASVLPIALSLASIYLSFAPVLFITALSLLVMFASFYIYYIPRTDAEMYR